MDYLEQFVPKVYFEKIPIKNLVSNQDYQRNLSQGHIEKAAENFDLYQINPVKVSRRDGVNYVFNGQHTIEIVAKVSGSRETPVWCMIYDDLSYSHEADIFAKNTLIPEQEYRKFVHEKADFTEEEIIAFSKRIQIHPGMIVGRLEMEKRVSNNSPLNSLRVEISP